MTNILTVVGARPQFVKAAVLSRLMRSEAYSGSTREILVHTGQHYDETMSDVFFREMRIPEPDVNLGVGGGTHGRMTGEMLALLEALVMERKPDLVLVYGDTNSTLAGALAASKLNVPVAHVEAGLRSFDKGMPEEQNRIVADHLSAWLLCPTDEAIANLSREGVADRAARGARPSSDAQRVAKIGDVMLDASLYYRGLAAARPEGERALARLGISGPFRLLTLHRAENTDDRARLSAIVSALNRADDLPLIFPVHPRTRKYLDSYGLRLSGHVRTIEPVGYFDMLELEAACSCVVTDSGGVQKEAYFFRKPCITLRDTTEWVETVRTGWNRLAGADEKRILEALASARPGEDGEPLYGDGKAGPKALDILLEGARA
jgi:UDP-GlcNAc3NAcA epimerase